ncbi:MAG TPA: hypothetical protein VIY48_16485 [Candidatus Paceibacterota bacterium]
MPLQFDFPVPTVYVNPFDALHSLGGQMGTTAPSSAAWSTANRAIMIPFRLFKPATAYKMGIMNGSVTSGNFDMGIYDIAGTLLGSTGSTLQSGANVLQEVALTAPVLLGAGYFYMALAFNNNTAQILRRSHNNDICHGMGIYQDASAFPLPAAIGFDAPTGAYVPLIGVKFVNV